jgi:hypothetical protein
MSNIIRPAQIADTGAFARSSIKLYFGADGSLTIAPVDTPAFQYDVSNLGAAPAALLEFAATNYIQNSVAAGAAAGTPGTAPSNWQLGTVAGISTSIIGSGVDHGIDYVDVRWFGTASAAGLLTAAFERAAPIAALVGQAWTVSMFQRLVGGSTGGLSAIQLNIDEIDASAATVSAGVYAQAAPTVGGLNGQLIQASRTLASVTTASALPYWSAAVSAGAVVDIALRIGLPQFERSAKATSRIRTTGAVATRAADVITGKGMVYCNAVEVAPAAYVPGTTYAFGVLASVPVAMGLIRVYRSLQDPNIGHAPASSPTWWEAVCDTYEVYSPTATYAKDYRVLDLAAHMVRESLVSSNNGQSLTDTTKWGKVGATNRWAAFDDVVGTSVMMPKAVLMLVIPGAVDSLGLLNIAARASTIAMIDPSRMEMVFSKSADLSNDSSILDYDQYFFEPEDLISDLYTDGLPPYYSGVLSIALTSTTTASLGVFKSGMSFDLGGAQSGLRVGFISYSKKDTNTSTGATSVAKGPNSKRMTVTTMIDNANLDKTQRVMAELDSVPTVIVGAGNLFTSLIQFGFVKSFETEIAYVDNSLCSFETEGLI